MLHDVNVRECRLPVSCCRMSVYVSAGFLCHVAGCQCTSVQASCVMLQDVSVRQCRFPVSCCRMSVYISAGFLCHVAGCQCTSVQAACVMLQDVCTSVQASCAILQAVSVRQCRLPVSRCRMSVYVSAGFLCHIAGCK